MFPIGTRSKIASNAIHEPKSDTRAEKQRDHGDGECENSNCQRIDRHHWFHADG